MTFIIKTQIWLSFKSSVTKNNFLFNILIFQTEDDAVNTVFVIYTKTRPVLDRFHDSSRVILLICLNLHSVLKAKKSMGKYEKVCQKLRSMPKVWENLLIAFIAVQMIFFWCAVQIFVKFHPDV